ncbi:hypothetical protein FJ695_00185 [Labrenzia sp. PHM005]|nr:hypothetical protein FJ695_00185 [Labrenzia sp. PHM005]
MDRTQKVYVCIHVYEHKHPVKLVVHEDGDWMFLCGELHDDNPDNYKAIGVGHLLDWDPSLSEVLDLENNYEAERTGINSKWMRTNLLSSN